MGKKEIQGSPFNSQLSISIMVETISGGRNKSRGLDKPNFPH